MAGWQRVQLQHLKFVNLKKEKEVACLLSGLYHGALLYNAPLKNPGMINLDLADGVCYNAQTAMAFSITGLIPFE